MQNRAELRVATSKRVASLGRALSVYLSIAVAFELLFFIFFIVLVLHI